VPCWTPPVITVDCDPYVLEFVAETDAVRSRIEVAIDELSPGCHISWPGSAAVDPTTVEISFAGVGDWVSRRTASQACGDRLRELLGEMEVGSVDVLQEMWPGFVGRWEEQRPSVVGENVRVVVDGDRCRVRVVGAREQCRDVVDRICRLRTELEDELKRLNARISERVPASKHHLSLMEVCGLLRTESAPAELAISVVDGTVVLEGQSEKVIDRKMKMLEFSLSAVREVAHVDKYVADALKEEPFRQHLDQVFQNIGGVVWSAVGSKIEVWGQNEAKVRRAVCFFRRIYKH